MRPTIPEAVVEGHSAEDITTSTQRVKAARSELLKNKRAAKAHATLSEQIAERLETKRATLGQLRRHSA